MSARPPISHPARRWTRALLAIPLALALAACSAPAASPAPADRAGSGSPAGGAAVAGTQAQPAVAPGGAPVAAGDPGASGSGMASSSGAIAYPYPGFTGTPGLAPDHTIVVTGTGQATVKVDLSDRAAAQERALVAALADAKAQADAVARVAGLTITGVLSVAASSGEAYALPMETGPAGTSAGPSGGTTPVPPMAPPVPAPGAASGSQLAVSVTVAYRIS